MSYQMRPDGRFRLRASFDIPAVLVERMNALCERTGLSMASLCLFACERLAAAAESGDLETAIAPAGSTGGGEAENPPSSGSPLQGGTARACPA